MESVNHVVVAGKVSRVGPLRYTPAGEPILEFTLAIAQDYLGKKTTGYLESVLTGVQAETVKGKIRVGTPLALEGRLWSRQFKDRAGRKLSETKFIVTKFEEEIKNQ